jgi:hypothetical protein
VTKTRGSWDDVDTTKDSERTCVRCDTADDVARTIVDSLCIVAVRYSNYAVNIVAFSYYVGDGRHQVSGRCIAITTTWVTAVPYILAERDDVHCVITVADGENAEGVNDGTGKVIRSIATNTGPC